MVYSVTRDAIACYNEFEGCCCCKAPQTYIILTNTTSGGEDCPEWKQGETIAKVSVYFKTAGVVALLCMSYHIGALTVSGLVHQNLKSYRTDYI